MKNKRNMVLAAMATSCFTCALFLTIPIQSAHSPYDPWVDINDDGKIDLKDLVLLANSYGTTGTPLTKAALYYDSGWINITDKCGQNIIINHDSNSTDLIVDIQGKTTANGGVHQINLDGTGHIPGWITDFGGVGVDCGNSIAATHEGGYAIAGYTNSYGAGNNDFWLVKTDDYGNVEWNKTYGGTGDDVACSLVVDSNSDVSIGFIMGGYTNSSGAGGYDFELVVASAVFGTFQSKTYGGPADDKAYSMVRTSDGGCALAGVTYSFGTNGDCYLVKTDSNYNMQWTRNYGGSLYDYANSVIQTSGGEYVLAGESHSFGANTIYMVKTDENGNLLWSKTYSGMTGGADEKAVCVVQTRDGGYALAARERGPSLSNSIALLIKTDENGNEQWRTGPITIGEDTVPYSLIQTSEGGYAITGRFISGLAAYRGVWLSKFDEQGVLQWNKLYSSTGDRYFFFASLVQVEGGACVLCGQTRSNQLLLVRTDIESGVAWTDSTYTTITLYRGMTDSCWNFVRVRLWMPRSP